MKRCLYTLALSAMLSAVAHADECAPSFARSIPTLEISVDPFLATPPTAVVLVPVDLGDAQCDVQLQFEPVGAQRLLRGERGDMEYRLITRDGPSRERLSGSGVIQSALRVTIEPSRLLSPGLYEGEVEARLLSPTGELLGDPLILAIRANVLPRAQANLAGAHSRAGSYAHVDFGILESGERTRLMLQVRSNTDITVQLSSLNESQLRLDDTPGAPGIQYNLVFDGETNSAGRSFVRSPRPTFSGEHYPIEIVVGSVTNAFAGRYRDVVTVTVTPN